MSKKLKNKNIQKVNKKKDKIIEQSKEDIIEIIEDVKKLPPKERELVSVLIRKTSPLPFPEDIEKYKKIDKSLPNRIFVLTEKEQDHRHYIDKKELEIFRKQSRAGNITNIMGVIFAFTICLLFCGASVYLIVNGFPIAGTIFGSGTLASIVGSFIYGTRVLIKKKQEKKK